MAECAWVILCDYAFLDVGRKSCIIGVFDRVFAPAVPSALHQSALVVRILGQANQSLHFRVEIVRPTGGQLARFEGDARCGETGSVDLQMNMAGLPMPDFGLYGFNVFEGEKMIGNASFVLQPTPQAPAAPSS